MSALPGYIDGHRHIMPDADATWLREAAPRAMQAYLDAGFTTLMSGGGPVPGIVELQQAIASGSIKGPRIITSGRADPENFPEEAAARAQVRALAAAGVDIVKARLEEGGQEILASIVDEARKAGLKVMVHAVTVPLTIAAVEAGVAKLVHTPTRSLIEETDGARIVSAAGVHMTSTLGIWVPIYGPDNEVQWRDGTPLPDDAIQRAGIGPVNGRHLWNAGVVYGFGTDTSFPPIESLAHELIPLRLVFSPRDIVKIMGPNSAVFVDKSADRGLLAAGKLADIVLVDGDPLTDTQALLAIRVVLKGGEIVADKR
jgi:imidazolonepropionase-like amidohydrolase